MPLLVAPLPGSSPAGVGSWPCHGCCVRRSADRPGPRCAQLANVGLTWYTWLEQGRQARPSASVLTAIADALRLDAHEREHLFALARDPEDQARGPEDHGLGRAPASAGPALEVLVRGFEPAPAYAISARAAMIIRLDDPAWTALPARLAQLSPDFARFWASSDVAGPERRLKRFRHPSAGPLTLHSTSLLMADDPMIRIVILYPATASDAARLERLGFSD